MMEKFACFHMEVVRSISRPVYGIARQTAFWAVDIYTSSLSFGSPSLLHGWITEILLTMLINSNAGQYAATFKTH